MIKISRYNKAVLELVFAGSIWGFSFTFSHWALNDYSAASIIFFRFLIAFVTGELCFYFFQKEKYQSSHGDILRAWPAGACLALSLLLQTTGLKYTTATNSSFITSLYIVLIPLISGLIFKTKITLEHIVLSLIAFIGMMFLLNIFQNHLSEMNFGDLLTLICAAASSFHIIIIGYKAPKIDSSFRFNNFQSFWALLVVFPYMIFDFYYFNSPLLPKEFHWTSSLSIVALALSASVFAFYLQVKAQKVLNTKTSSLLFLLEAPYAFLFAAIFLNERLNPVQILGILIILLSSIFSVYMDRPKN